MMTVPSKTVKLKDFPETFVKGLKNPLGNAGDFFKTLGVVIDRDTILQFKTQGARGGSKWKKLNNNTLRTKAGTYNIRYGTDLKGRTKGTYKPGALRKGIRRYSSSSKPLLASGLFQKSFRIMTVNKRGLKYGTDHELAGKIGSNPTRQVLVVTKNDLETYEKMWAKHWNKEIKF